MLTGTIIHITQAESNQSAVLLSRITTEADSNHKYHVFGSTSNFKQLSDVVYATKTLVFIVSGTIRVCGNS